ncbi:MAG: sialate O-acetylesterase [Phycisphaerales bacterium]|nr:sialate O-acetylesterase [Phycisphaerales bacterium]
MLTSSFCSLALALSSLSQPAPVPDKDVIKVFLLAGQSNMEGQAVVDLDHPEYYNGGRGILTTILKDPAIAEEFGHWRNADGTWAVRDDVFVSYQPERGPHKAGPLSIGYAGYQDLHHFGPEMELGWELGEHFDEPVLLVKTCWGGKSLMNDFRPPSSGGTVGPYYLKMIEEYRAAIASIRTHFPQLGGMKPELAGFVWFQGWNDMFTDGGLEAYADNLANLVKDLRRELDAPELPFVVGQTGNADNRELWAAQEAATLRPEFTGRAVYVPTRAFLRKPEDSPNTGHGHHWFGNAESYLRAGDAMGQAMVSLQEKEAIEPSSP